MNTTDLVETSVILYLHNKIPYCYDDKSPELDMTRSLALSNFDNEEQLNIYIAENFSPGSEKYMKYFPCQVFDISAQAVLTCDYQEGGGKQCERLDPHTYEHKWTDHLISHEQFGNGYSCRGIGNDIIILKNLR